MHKQALLLPFIPLLFKIAEQLIQIPPITALIVRSQIQVEEVAFQRKPGAQSQILAVAVPSVLDKVLQFKQPPVGGIMKKDELQMQEPI
jgi:hypothetical protein